MGEGAVEQGMSGMDRLGKLQSRPSVAGALMEWLTCDCTHPILGGQERLPKSHGV